MKKEYIPFVEELIELAIREDIGDGDHTSLATIPADARGKMQLLVKQDGIIAGIEVARMVFDRLDGSVAFDQRIEDGACVRRGDIASTWRGASCRSCRRSVSCSISCSA